MRKMRKRWIAMGCIAAVCALNFAVGPLRGRTSLADSTTTTITCSESSPVVRRFIQKVAILFEEGTGVQVKYYKSREDVIEQVLDGDVDWACMMRHLTDVEKLKKLKESQVGWDAYAVIVNPNNPCGDLSVENLAKIFTGEIVEWKLVGGPEKKRITVFAPSRRSLAYKTLEEAVLFDGTPSRRIKWTASEDRMINSVARNRTAIGIVPVADIKDNADVKVLSIDGQNPSIECVARKKYPLVQPIVCVTGPDSSKETTDFLKFCLTPTAQDIMAEYYMPFVLPKN